MKHDLLKNMSPAVRERNKHILEPEEKAVKVKQGRPEGEFQDVVIAYAETRGWRCYHTYDSRRSNPGFPDLVLLRESRIVIAELKAGDNTTTPEQDVWLRAWLDAGAQVYEWRDTDWAEIERVLR